MKVDPIPIVPEVSIELYLIVVNPRALNSSGIPSGGSIVTVGIDRYPYPLLPIEIESTCPSASIVEVASASYAPDIKRLDEVGAARNLKLVWEPD